MFASSLHVIQTTFDFATCSTEPVVTQRGRTPLHEACLSGSIENQEWLIKHGAPLYGKDAASHASFSSPNSLPRHPSCQQQLAYPTRNARQLTCHVAPPHSKPPLHKTPPPSNPLTNDPAAHTPSLTRIHPDPTFERRTRRQQHKYVAAQAENGRSPVISYSVLYVVRRTVRLPSTWRRNMDASTSPFTLLSTKGMRALSSLRQM